MENKIFTISGEKLNGFIADNRSLKFSSREPESYQDFKQAWEQKISFSRKIEIKYEDIQYIKIEEGSDVVIIKHKCFWRFFTCLKFNFMRKNDDQILYDFLIQKQFFTKYQEKLSPSKAIKPQLIAWAITMAIGIYYYVQAAAIASGNNIGFDSPRKRIFNNLLKLIGTNGVLLVLASVTAYLFFKAWKRYCNPPVETKLKPMNRV